MDDSRCYYVVKYDYRTDDGDKLIVERVFDIYDDAKDYVDCWGSDTESMIEKRKYGNPYTVIQKPKVDETDISKKDQKMKALEVNNHINEIVIEHLNGIIKNQKDFYEATIAKLTKFFNKEIQDVLTSQKP